MIVYSQSILSKGAKNNLIGKSQLPKNAVGTIGYPYTKE